MNAGRITIHPLLQSASGLAGPDRSAGSPHAARNPRLAPSPLPARERELRETRSTCPYCGVGCGVIIESQGTTITGVRGDPEHPANFGRLCTKGSTLALTAAPHLQAHRALQPMLRTARGQALQATTWDTALDTVAQRIATTVAEHGPDAVGLYLSGQLLTEDYYVFNKLGKGLIGTNNVDTNSRLCMSSAVAGYKQTLGADAPPTCYDDVHHASCIFIVGSNTAYAHPILFRRIEDAKLANPALKIIFCDPRRTDTAEIADLYLPIQPGTDVMLFNGMLHIMLWEGWIDAAYIAAHTNDFDALKATVRDCTPDLVAEICGIKKADLFTAAKLFATSSATLSLYCQGLNQSSSGTAKNAALINLHLATAQIGKPGAGPFSLTGQPNAMGGREVGGLANLISAHRDMANPIHRAEVAALWGVQSVPDKPGKTAIEMFQAAADGEIKALWIACTNPAQSMPDQATVRRALERAELVIVQEAFATPSSCDYADLLLPATTWGEKTGTVTNSERRVSRVRSAVAAPGETRHDWSIAVEFAQRLEVLLGAGSPTLFPYSLTDQNAGTESIWNEHRESTRGRDLDITGMSYAMLEAAPQQWPLREGESAGKVRLYEDGIFPTADGRARFVNTIYKPVAEPRESRYPFSLTTGRLRDQWHGMSRTGTLGRLFAHTPEPAVLLHPQELARRHWQAGDLVRVKSRRGELVLPVAADDGVAPAQAFIAMHWGPEFIAGAGVNAVTSSATCPQSGQPELKHAAVRLDKAELPWQLVAAAWLPHERALAVQLQLRALFALLAFASCVPFGREPDTQSGLLFRAAASGPMAAVLAAVEDTLGIAHGPALRYADIRSGQHRAMRLHAGGQLQAFVIAGDVQAAAWVLPLLQQSLPAAAYGRALLAASKEPPGPMPSASAQVCACHDVSARRIAEALQLCTGTAAERLQQLQRQLRCGTDCGSCLPAVKALVHRFGNAAVAPGEPATL